MILNNTFFEKDCNLNLIRNIKYILDKNIDIYGVDFVKSDLEPIVIISGGPSFNNINKDILNNEVFKISTVSIINKLVKKNIDIDLLFIDKNFYDYRLLENIKNRDILVDLRVDFKIFKILNENKNSIFIFDIFNDSIYLEYDNFINQAILFTFLLKSRNIYLIGNDLTFYEQNSFNVKYFNNNEKEIYITEAFYNIKNRQEKLINEFKKIYNFKIFDNALNGIKKSNNYIIENIVNIEKKSNKIYIFKYDSKIILDFFDKYVNLAKQKKIFNSFVCNNYKTLVNKKNNRIFNEVLKKDVEISKKMLCSIVDK